VSLDPRDTPDYVNRLIGFIVLQNQDAWPLRVGGVVLDHDGSAQSVDDIVHLYTVGFKFLVAVE
jgi:hypothetical protein